MNDKPKGILLDVEGTTSKVSYVYEVLFPFARSGLSAFLDANWDSYAMCDIREQVASDTSCPEAVTNREMFEAEILKLMEGDVKATGLKQLQGLVWQSGFASGELVAQVFDDVPPALERWQQAGIDRRIFSSGSVHAQKMFFAHTEKGNLLSYFSGHYDTKVGSKREAESYRGIVKDWQLAPEQILFVSDVVAELDAAREAGLHTMLCVRPGNAAVEPGHGHPICESFEEIELGE